MKDILHKEQLMSYAKQLLAPAQVEEIELSEVISDAHGDTHIWEITCDTMEEYWLIEQDSPCALFRKSGIYALARHAYEAYLEQLEQKDIRSELKDREQYMTS